MLSAKDHMREMAIVNLTVENGPEQGGEGFCPQENMEGLGEIGALGLISGAQFPAAVVLAGREAVGFGYFHPIVGHVVCRRHT